MLQNVIGKLTNMAMVSQYDVKPNCLNKINNASDGYIVKDRSKRVFVEGLWTCLQASTASQ